jgi:hypothetical protein
MLWQAPEAEVFPLCSANGISQIVWSPLAQGVLTGKYKPGQPLPADSRFASDAMNFAQGLVYNDETLAAVQRLIPVAEGAGLSLPTLALTWVLRRGEVASRRRGRNSPPTCWPRSTPPSALRRSGPPPSRCSRRRASCTVELGYHQSWQVMACR